MSLNVNGLPDKGLLHDEHVFDRLQPLVQPLVAGMEAKSLSAPTKDGPLTAKQLAQFVYDVGYFQENVLGFGAARPAHPSARDKGHEHPVRLPQSLLLTHPSHTNFAPLDTKAPLYALLQACFEFLAERGEASWDMEDAAKRGLYVDMIASVRTRLAREGKLSIPRIAVSREMTEAEIAHLRSIIDILGWHWADDHANATHILKPSSETLPDLTATEKPPESEYFRVVAHNDKRVLIHVWYRPDSYDTWLPDKDFSLPEPAPPQRTSAWQISARWLRDAQLYNEVMNEEDYDQDEENAADAEQASAADTVDDTRRARKHSLPETISDDAANKRIKLLVSAKPSNATPVDLSGSQPIPGKKYESEPVPGSTLGNLPAESSPLPSAHADASQPVRTAATEDAISTPAPPTSIPETLDADEAAQTARKYLSEQTQEVVIPSYSTWFDMSTINPIERRSLHEFFNNKNRSKTPSVYKDYRDFMVNTYRMNPSEYLTFTACRRNLAGDVCAIMRVHAFLEQWGLINYQIDPETRPAALGPPFTGHFRVLVDTPRGLAPLNPSIKQDAVPTTQEVKQERTGETLSLELRRSVFQSSLKGSKTVDFADANSLAAQANKELEQGSDKKPQYACDTCAVDCTSVRYQSARVKDFALCPPCYLEGRFPTSMYSGDFVRLDEPAFKQPGGVSGLTEDDWSDQETLRLLEGIEMYEEDWTMVASHVGTRSREQCITKFIQLPIQDKFLDGAMPQSALGGLQFAPTDPASGEKGTPLVPFAQADNPVMSVVSLLASAVSPAVAAAAAQSALGELTDGVKKRIDAAAGAPQVPEPMHTEASAEENYIEDTKEHEGAEDLASDADKAKEAEAEAVPHSAVERAASIALGAAAAKAYVLASYEERECQRLVQQVIEAQMKKMELKMTQFEELESLLESECRTIEAGRKQLYADRLAVQRQLAAVHELLRKANEAPKEVRPDEVAQVSSAAQGLPQQGPVVRQGPAETAPHHGAIGRIN
ncbi:SWI/SNF and RSC complex subunit Ssr2 [Malassezia vespertilionis]|uniref:Swi3p n=1 Tax=Malassezia vespertilionis TaxID=2020962 RepID=A0A2N1JE99_9BASI|nr:SWI/SNF and RSC complex subunit Ssr2 [Malassezia vespertilionis]PKI84863.1 hypothetical protein MVES_000805 [Malassezia vespertilionis]WFD05528.1 SWI/SNF and RSC complex subunit Ssr2 [Malassezia vespertilionis]